MHSDNFPGENEHKSSQLFVSTDRPARRLAALVCTLGIHAAESAAAPVLR